MKAIFYPDVPFHSLAFEWIFKEIWLDQVYKEVVANGRKDMVMIDIGANIGLVTHYLRDFCSHMYCIEPSSEHYEALVENKNYNHWDNVSVHNLAIWKDNCQIGLKKNDSNRTMHSLVFPNGGERQLVQAYTLETFFDINTISQVDFIKMDVEGAEYEIMTNFGFTNVISRVKSMEIEYHDERWEQLDKIMLDLGFKHTQCNTSAVVYYYYR